MYCHAAPARTAYQIPGFAGLGAFGGWTVASKSESLREPFVIGPELFDLLRQSKGLFALSDEVLIIDEGVEELGEPK